MQILDLVQGSPEWKATRAVHFTASEASVMKGASTKVTRNELLHMKTTGTEQEFSDWVQENILDNGHKVEAQARPIAEAIVGEELYPATAVDDDGYLLASFDGVTMMENVIWEHKQWNEAKAATVREGNIPDEDYWQVVQQLLVSGAEKCLYMVSDGTREKCVTTWAELDHDDAQSLLAGWAQFEADMKGFKKPEYKPEPTGTPVEDFPALFADITGDVQGTNLATYQQAVLGRIQAINTDLTTDQDFADAETMVKFLDKAEKEIEAVKKQALAKTASIDDLFRTMDHLREEMRGKRLELNKLVTERKKEVKVEIAQSARAKVDAHVEALNESLGGRYMPQVATDFNGAMKGKRTVATLQSAADDEVARAKIEANETAELIRGNLKLLDSAAHPFLFNDRNQLLTKPSADLAALITARESEHEKAEAKRQEQEREQIRAEEAEKLRRAQEHAATSEQGNHSPAVENTCTEPTEVEKPEAPQKHIDNPVAQPPLTEYQAGYIDGLKAYAWWKDGEQYVGTGGTTLRSAIARIAGSQEAA